MRFQAFKALRQFHADLSHVGALADYGIGAGTPGYTYQADERCPLLFIVKDGSECTVDLFADEPYTGTLEDCEAELWHAFLENTPNYWRQ